MEVEMQIEEAREIIKTANFLAATAHFIEAVVKGILEMAGCEIAKHGEALELRYDVKHGDKTTSLFFRNLYLEIATVDRDAERLEFDERLRDYAYFLSKTSSVVKSRLEILLKMLYSEDTDKTIDEIFNDFKGGRLYIERLGDSSRSKGG